MPGPPWRYVLSHQPVAVHRRRALTSRTPAIVLASVATRLLILWARLRWRWQVTGTLPAAGAVLVSAHTSYWDGLLACMLDARVFPVAGQDWRSMRFASWYLRTYGVLWTDEDPLGSADAVLSEGGLVWIAPAGWEKAGRGTLRRGAAQMAVSAQVPVHLLRIDGLPSARFRRGPLQLTLTELIPYDPDLTVEQINAVLLAHLHRSS